MSSGPAVLDTKALEERLRPRILVGNAGDYEAIPQVAGRFFPVGPGADAVIGDIQDYPWAKDAAGKRVRNWGKKETTVSALDVAKAIVADENFGPKGLFIKVGDAAIDEQSRQAARARFVAWQTDYCLAIESAWIAKVAAHHGANPGAAPLRQPRLVQKALGWLTLNQGETDNAARKEFICRTCSSEFDVEVHLNDHIVARHPALAREITAAVASAPAPSTPYGDEYDPSVLLAKARELKVKLLKEELEGLIDGTPEVVKAVTAKLAEAAGAAKK